ncbi:hypothetical protein Acr_00g0101210 [Actinidia rufa]|uniref:Reverse transcriptase zinc-binding domain-containing protein n=1 Tax=Actinidia rufa TaxID=165716 RepID=A0A7J0E137_9ERIC|nr:hypothetical protein Acr_00g0101210 [Actinidia rufa]
MQSGSSCGGQELSWFWKMLWQLKIPSKIKVFAWKCCMNILPVKANFIQKKMSVSGSCDSCGGGETVRHCFQECEFADSVWAAVGLYPVWQDGALSSFFDWVWRIVKHDESAHCRESVVWKPSIGGKFKVNFEGGVVQGSKCDRYQSDYSELSWKTSISFILEDVMDS